MVDLYNSFWLLTEIPLLINYRFCIHNQCDQLEKVIYLLGLKTLITVEPLAPSSLKQEIWVRFAAWLFFPLLWGEVAWLNLLLLTDSYIIFQTVLTSIVLKSNITMFDIVSTRMLGQYGFLAKVQLGLHFL